MAIGETTNTIVVDSDGRITALLELAKGSGLHNLTSVTSLPLKVGDRIFLKSAESKQPSVAEAQRHPKLMEHAIDTFGSEEVAMEWLSSECGALNNESPNNFIRMTGNVAEVDRILTCIDYGMIA